MILILLAVSTVFSAFYFTPSVSPTGSKIAFAYMGDIWVFEGDNDGYARRLTDSKGYDRGPVFWSEDGKYVFFSSNRYGNMDIFRISVDGKGDPKRLTYHPGYEKILGIRDGYVYFSASRTEFRGAVYRVSENGGFPEKVWDFEVNALSFGKQDTVFFERGYTPSWRRKYRGPANRDIWIMQSDESSMHKITTFSGRDAFPMYSPYDGKVYFISNDNKDNVNNLYRMNPDGTEREQITFFNDEVFDPFMSRDGKTIVFTVMGRIYRYNVVDNTLDTLNIHVSEDKKSGNPYYKTLTKDATEMLLSPTGKELAFVLFGDIYVMKLKDDGTPQNVKRITFTPEPEKDLSWNPVKEELVFTSLKDGNWNIYAIKPKDDSLFADATEFEWIPLASSPITEKNPIYSKDGKWIAFKKGEGTLYVMRSDGTDKRKLADFNDVLWVSWSWDSKWIAFSRTALGWREDVYVVPLNGEKRPINITNHPNDDYKPMWSYDGRRISFASRDDKGDLYIKYVVLRKEDAGKDAEYYKSLKDSLKSPGEVKIDFDGIEDRIRTVYRFHGDYNYFTQDRWGLLFAVEAEDLGKDDIWKVDIGGEGAGDLTHGASPKMFYFDPSGKSIFYLTGSGKIHRVLLSGKDNILPFKETILINNEDYRRSQMLELWWLLNDGFYDPNFHGVNWKKMLEKYMPYAKRLYNDQEFYAVVSYMLGELNASHLGIWSRYSGFSEKAGLLGGAYKREKDGFLIKRVIYNSPLYIAGLKKGDEIIKIGSTSLDTANIYRALLFTQGKKIKITYKRGKKEYTTRIEPVSYYRIRDLLYHEWVRANRDFVDSMSGGTLAYVHIRSMDLKSVNNFMKSLYKQRHKKGLVLDIRYNGGGSTHDIILNFLRRTHYLYSVERGENEKEYSSLFSWDKPVVLLINNQCYSDAEIFPAGFKALKLGKIVGTPTFGAVIGTENKSLFDAKTIFRVPEEGWYTLNGKSLELGPVMPDIYVENPPIYDNVTGDPQLKMAIKVIKDAH